MIQVSELYIYPVKSLAGIALNTVNLTPLGFAQDRRWMIVDDKGKFMSQRETHKMACIKTSLDNQQLILSYAQNSITVPNSHEKAEKMTVTVWKDTFEANLLCSKVDSWLSNILGSLCHLVYMSDAVNRQIDTDFAQKNNFVSFADAFPLLVISQASLDDLNSRLQKLVNINRFRPNIVVSGTTAFAEDTWQNLTIGDTKFKAVKKCSRCIMPSINQKTGTQDQVKMLAALNTYRKEDNKIKFGQNLIYKDSQLINGQTISCQDEIILE